MEGAAESVPGLPTLYYDGDALVYSRRAARWRIAAGGEVDVDTENETVARGNPGEA